MDLIVDYLSGRWSFATPAQRGVYFMRQPGDGRAWVSYWDPAEFVPFQGAPASTPSGREFFHLDEDANGQPTRWDDPRVAELARANEWREPPNLRRRGPVPRPARVSDARGRVIRRQDRVRLVLCSRSSAPA